LITFALAGRVGFINILHALFFPDILAPKISSPKHSFVIFGAKISAQNVVEIET